MIDWTKPLELMDGTPCWLAKRGFQDGPNPDMDGDYWVEGPNGYRECVGPKCGSNATTQVRNRPEVTMATAELVSMDYPTLRDRFAMAALTGLIANQQNTGTAEEVAITSYAIATAMLRARGEG